MTIARKGLPGGDSSILRGITSVNVIVGRNGAGKSRFLRELDATLSNDKQVNVRYICPERAGVLQPEGSVITSMELEPNRHRLNRRRNQDGSFKATSAHFLRELETVYNRRIVDTPALRNDPERCFSNDLLRRINSLLPNLSVQQDKSSFFFISAADQRVKPDQISSGESEAITLATEILYFFETLDPARFNVLLLDEPDVHLHPDLQARLAHFLLRSVTDLSETTRDQVTVCIATHSTPLICALAPSAFTSIGIKDFQNNVVRQVPSSEQLKKVAPFFGHPLSLTISGDVMLIVEGEDDERVWQQAARSSQGKIRLFPVLATSVHHQNELEKFSSDMLTGLFDDPVAYSLRDGDGIRESLQPAGVVTRFRLQCYEIENALLTDECLDILGTTWDGFIDQAQRWIDLHPEHKDLALVKILIASADRLRDTKIKAIRQLICSIGGSNKQWEVVVGQAIGKLNPLEAASSPSSLISYLGERAARTLLS